MDFEDDNFPFGGDSGRVVTVPAKLNIFRQPSLKIKSGETFASQPWIELLDENGGRVISSEFSVSVRLVDFESEVEVVRAEKEGKKVVFKNLYKFCFLESRR